MAQLANATWLTNPAYTGRYVSILAQQFEKIDQKNWSSVHVIAMHRTDAVLTALCDGKRKDTVFFGCPVCPEQLICLFRALLRMDRYVEELAPIPTVVQVYSAIRTCYATTRQLVFLGADGNSPFKKDAGRVVMTAHSIKRKAITAKLISESLLRLAGATGMKDMLDIVKEMSNSETEEEKQGGGNSNTTALKLTPEGSYFLTDAEKRDLASQLREFGGPSNMPLESCRLLMNAVGKSIASYSPGTSDLASIPSTAPLVAFITNAAAKLTGTTHIRRVPAKALLKLTTLRMTLGDSLELVFFGPMVVKNGELVNKTIKKEANQFSEATFTQERQDQWAKIDNMDNFGIAARGMALAVDLLVHPFILTKEQVMGWFLTTACIYEEYDAQLHVQAAAQIFKEGITLYYSRVRAYLERTEEAAPPRLTTTPEVLMHRIAHVREVKRLMVGSYIIPEQDAGLTGYHYKQKSYIDFQGKSVSIDKSLKRVWGRGSDSEDEITQDPKKHRREKPSQHNPLCFFCSKKGHRSR